MMVMLMMKKKMVMILLMMNGKIDESCPILPHNYTPCISMYSLYILVKALGCSRIPFSIRVPRSSSLRNKFPVGNC